MVKMVLPEAKSAPHNRFPRAVGWAVATAWVMPCGEGEWTVTARLEAPSAKGPAGEAEIFLHQQDGDRRDDDQKRGYRRDLGIAREFDVLIDANRQGGLARAG